MPTQTPLPPVITTNEFFRISGPPPPITQWQEVQRLVFFVTGNPGLVGYYHGFLSMLSQNLGAGAPTAVYGASLGGFGVESLDARREGKETRAGGGHGVARVLPPTRIEELKKAPYGLQDQIGICWERLQLVTEALLGGELVQDLNGRDHGHRISGISAKGSKPSGPLEVVLIGHSVGTYICLEMIRLHQERSRHSHQLSSLASALPLDESTSSYTTPLTILLTPTLTHLSHSPSGRLLTPLFRIPYLPELAQSVVGVITKLTPAKIFTQLVKSVTGNPPTPALETTVKFLSSPGGVRQALHMARDEMREICEDRWSEELWSASANATTQGKEATKLILWYAERDHWVDDTARENLLRERSRRQAAKSKDSSGYENGNGVGTQELWDDINDATNMNCSSSSSDKGRSDPTFLLSPAADLVHAFCFRHSELVARRVSAWILEWFDGNGP